VLRATTIRLAEAVTRSYASGGDEGPGNSLLQSSALDRLVLEEEALRVGSDAPSLRDLAHAADLAEEEEEEEEEEEINGHSAAGAARSEYEGSESRRLRSRRTGHSGRSSSSRSHGMNKVTDRTAIRLATRARLAKAAASLENARAIRSRAAIPRGRSRALQNGGVVSVVSDSVFALVARSFGVEIVGTSSIVNAVNGISYGTVDVQCPFASRGESWDAAAWVCVGSPSNSPSPGATVVPS